MKIRVTSVSNKDVTDFILSIDFTVKLEDGLKPSFESKVFGSGIDQFTIVLVSVDSDPQKNKRFIDDHQKVGYYKDHLTKERVNYLSIAVPMNPEEVLKMDESTLRKEFIRTLYSRLENQGLKIPKKFDYLTFLAYLKEVLPLASS
jgi:hypothetical protein